jgi:hypothetical protein
VIHIVANYTSVGNVWCVVIVVVDAILACLYRKCVVVDTVDTTVGNVWCVVIVVVDAILACLYRKCLVIDIVDTTLV